MDGKASTVYNVLEHMLLDESEKPRKLPLSLLEAITNDFSTEQEIGRGGFAVVYKGILGLRTVAVKKLSGTVDMDEEKFSKEVQCLLKVRHKNIVRFLGYCADTQGEMVDYGGRSIMADVRNRALCFEFVPNGSLHAYITDASCGLEWRVRYQMIKGICEGLHYLHKNRIVHLDLKPANILVDDNMVPKIADFGLSRCFDEKQSKAVTLNLIGSIGYLAPEFYSGQITFKLDIYSLGVIIMEILTGEKGYSTVEKVLESWRDRIDIPLQQVRACAQIGTMCIDANPVNRPNAHYIIKTFKDLVGTNESIEGGVSSSSEAQISGGSDVSKFLRVHPLQLRFPLESDKLMISCPLHLTNITDDHVAFRLLTMRPKENFKGPLCGIVPPRSRYTLAVTMCSQLKLPSRSEIFFTLETSIDVYQVLQEWAETYAVVADYTHLERLFTSAKEKGHEVRQVKLTAAYILPGPGKSTSNAKIMITLLQDVSSIDVHPTEPWILTGHSNGFVHIRNYHTQEIVKSFEVSKGSTVRVAKFIARKEWFVAGDWDGFMYIYGYDKLIVKKCPQGRSPVTVAIHPTEPYVLLMNHYYTELWDWEKDWQCIWYCNYPNYEYVPISDAKFNPEETTSFAAAFYSGGVKVWDAGSNSLHMRQLFCHDRFRPLCLDYVTRDNELYLITGCTDRTAKIWDYQTGSCVQTLEGHTERVTSVCSHSDLPILITGSMDGTVRLWNSMTFKAEGVIDCGLRGVTDIYCLQGSRRIVIIHEGALAITDIGQ